MKLWKDIPNFEGLYQASINGEIRSINHIRKNGTNKYEQKGKILKFTKNHSGYYQVRLSKNGVAKINIDTDLRLAMTSTIREFFVEHPEKFDPREYMGPGRTAVKELVKHKMVDVLGTAGHADD